MTRLSISETTTLRWSFEEDVVRYRQAGIHSMGAWRHKLSDFDIENGAAFLKQNEMAVSHLFWAGGFTGSEGRSFEDSVIDAREAIRTASILGTDYLVIYSGSRLGHTDAHARRLFCDALDELLPLAKKLGIFLLIEPMHPGCAIDWTVVTSLEESLQLIDQIGHPNLRLLLDTYHVGLDERLFEQIEAILPHLGLVQLGDRHRPPRGEQNRCLLGQGRVPLRRIIDHLKAAGYEGDYDVELFGEDLEIKEYGQLLEHAKELFETLVHEESFR